MHHGKTLKEVLEKYKRLPMGQRLTKEEIATKIGVAPSTLYRYFTLETLDDAFIDMFCEVMDLNKNIFASSEKKEKKEDPVNLLKTQIEYQNGVIDRLLGVIERMSGGGYEGMMGKPNLQVMKGYGDENRPLMYAMA